MIVLIMKILKNKTIRKRKENYNIEMIYYNEKNKRIAETRRIGANLVKTKYLMYLADDDMLVCLNEKNFKKILENTQILEINIIVWWQDLL